MWLRPWVYLVILASLLLITMGTFAFGSPDPHVCTLEVTHESTVECYLGAIAEETAFGASGSVLADIAAVGLVVGTLVAALGLARVGGGSAR